MDSLLLLKREADAEGRPLSSVELQALADEAQAAIDEAKKA